MNEEDNNELDNLDKKSIKDSAQEKINELRGLTLGGIFTYLKRLFNLSHGSDEKLTVEEINNNIEFRGANLWILAFSIMVASIGLNTNSGAVIIGAMLISPLMGPIMGSGLAVGINDFDMLKRSLRNLAIAVIIAILTSTFYFAISPLSQAHSELLARTKPTFYDVGIALFGGLAGIVGASRKSKGNVIPGVAIATALMPPLCTAGYGLATGKFGYFLGAFYLFFINSVFISLSTVLIVRILKFKQKSFMDKQKEKRATRYIALAVLVTIIPSIWLGTSVVREEIFRRNAVDYITDNFQITGTRVGYYDLKYDSDLSNIVISLDGRIIPQERVDELKNMAAKYELTDCKVEIYQDNDPTVDIEQKIEDRIRSGMTETLYQKNEELLKDKDKKIKFLENELLNSRGVNHDVVGISGEVGYAFPDVKKISLANMISANVSADSDGSADTIITALITIEEKPEILLDKTNFKSWLQRRLKIDSIEVLFRKYDPNPTFESTSKVDSNKDSVLN